MEDKLYQKNPSSQGWNYSPLPCNKNLSLTNFTSGDNQSFALAAILALKDLPANGDVFTAICTSELASFAMTVANKPPRERFSLLTNLCDYVRNLKPHDSEEFSERIP